MTYTLYGHPLSSCTRKVLMTLAEKGARADLVVVDLFTHAHKEKEHLARHPFGVIPVLEHDGFSLYESRAIIRHLDATLGGTPLTPTAARDIARMNQWLSVDQSYVAPHTRSLAVERILKKHQGKEADAIVTNAAEDALAVALGVYDRALATRPYLAGDALSLADISLAPYVASLPMIGAAHVAASLSRVADWWKRVSERPSWRAAVDRGSL